MFKRNTIEFKWIQTVQVTCFECGQEFTFTGEFERGFDPAYDLIACIPCARRLGDDTMKACLNCGSQYQGFSLWDEACSDECGTAIDLAVERAQERDLRREQQRLEAIGNDPEPEQPTPRPRVSKELKAAVEEIICAPVRLPAQPWLKGGR
jgi:hypothetical protein